MSSKDKDQTSSDIKSQDEIELITVILPTIDSE